MKRCTVTPRVDWQAKADAIGLTYHSRGLAPTEDNPGVFWDEAIYYRFSDADIEILESATADLHALCLKAVDHVCTQPDLLEAFGIPAPFRPLVIQSWQRSDPSIMGRFDLAFDPDNASIAHPKLLEYNADTPTLVIETALMQWFWLQDIFPSDDQFNSLHEKLIDRYQAVGEQMRGDRRLVISTLTLEEAEEEFRHGEYFIELASRAGLSCEWLAIRDVGYRPSLGFVDLKGRPINYWSKLYPWEWLTIDSFGTYLIEDKMSILEPAWKMLLSNKALLAVLWQLFPNHPNLLPASLEQPATADYVAKPIVGREGANIELNFRGRHAVTPGTYAGRCIYQQAVDTRRDDGCFVCLGSWIVGKHPAGLIVREDDQPIINGASRVVPHIISAI